MATIHLTGRVTDKGELEVSLPPGLPAGEARITIEVPAEPVWTPERIREALQVEPLTGAEIVEAGLIGGWEEEGITDGAEWVEELRRKKRERREW